MTGLKTRFATALGSFFGLLFWLGQTGPASATDHVITMHGEAKYGADFQHFDYANPDAPKGGTLVLSRIGSFDSLNRHIIHGVPAQGLNSTAVSLTQPSLLMRSQDEPFSMYAFVADRIEMPDDRRAITFHIRQGAVFHNGDQVTAEDIAFTMATLRDSGRPNHRYYYSQVNSVEILDPLTLRLHLTGDNRELPLIMGYMPVLSKADIEARDFQKTTLTPLQGAGPYKISKVDPGRSLTFERIPGHWSETVPAARGLYNFDRVRFDYYRDAGAALVAFKAGDVDLREESDPRQWATAYEFPARQAGDVKLQSFTHQRPVGMYALVLNGRRSYLSDPAVRQAIGYGLDFDWVNRNLYHGAYHRTASYFENSELAATGLPNEAELALLEPYKADLPAALFTEPYNPPGADIADPRRRLRAAKQLLADAGWQIKDGVLVSPENGAPLRIEIMLVRRENEKLALHLQRNLKRLGIAVEVRLVDSAQYQERRASYDYDAFINLWGQSLSPGNEQAFYWSTDSAMQEGTRNYGYVKNPAVDAMIERLGTVVSREDLVNAVRAMDRALLWGHHVVPLFHLKGSQVAYWDKFGRPELVPSTGYRLEAWWWDAEKAAKLSQ